LTRLTRPDQPVGDAFWGKSLFLAALVCPRPFGSFEKGTIDHRAKDLPSEQNWQAQRRALKACTFYCFGYLAAPLMRRLLPGRTCPHRLRRPLFLASSPGRSLRSFPAPGRSPVDHLRQPISRSAWLRTTDPGSVRDDRRRSPIELDLPDAPINVQLNARNIGRRAAGQE
jgi:hypothetical protein